MVAAAHHGDVEKIWLRWLTTPEQLRDNHASSETMRWRHGGSMETTSRRWRQSRKKKLTIVLFPLTATRLRHLSRSRFFRHSIKRFIVSPLLQSSFQFLSLSSVKVAESK
ncbi:unnamed protein product [Brassica oleracea var. botrytis]|nr:hypothetical protein F2Q69_00009007 [Brassica cretica]KAF3550985.1 hypothetical protein DY000_02009484 [Brassica cretica]